MTGWMETTPDGPIAILGEGAWGAALGFTLKESGADVRYWTRNSGPGPVEGASLVLSAVPAQATRGVLQGLSSALPADAPLILTAKGLERQTLKLQSDVASEAATGNPVAILTGPSFAADLSKGLPTAVTLACSDPELGQWLQKRLATPSLRPYLTSDVIGAQIGGALKNVMAIACGAAVGAGLGESARAALMTRGFAELARLGEAMGARRDTLAGLSGLGDLALTCASDTSRNFAYGQALGRGRTPAELAADGTTYEGASTAAAAVSLAEDLGVDAPISATVARLVEGALDVPEAIRTLYTRPLTRET